MPRFDSQSLNSIRTRTKQDELRMNLRRKDELEKTDLTSAAS